MKKSILLLLACLFTSQIFAQFTIERQDYTMTSAGATVNCWQMDETGVSLPAEGADVVWNYSAQALTGSFHYTKNPVSEPLFPNANLVEYGTGVALNLVPMNINFYEQLADDGYKTLGRTTPEVALPAQALTGGPNDTITFLSTVSVYEEPNYYVKFPLHYEDNWNAEFNIIGNYLMTVQAFGLDHVPASSTYNYVKTNTVVGHGTLILPHPDGTGTVTLEALLLKTTTVRTDSFFLVGQPAPAIMLNALGLVQGNTETYSEYTFFAKGLIRSALSMDTDNGQVTNITLADDIKNIVSSTTQVADILIDAKVFPNPTSGDFQVAFEKSDALPWVLELYNSFGQMVFHQNIEGASGKTVAGVSLPPATPAGLDHFVIRNADGLVVANGSLIVK